jgi:hypothetical protein
MIPMRYMAKFVSVASAGAGRRRFSEAGVVNSWNDSIVASFNSVCNNGFGGPGPEFRLGPRSNVTFDCLPC